MKNTKFIEIYEKAFASFFKKESQIQKSNPDIYEFAIRYTAFRLGLANTCTEVEREESQDSSRSSLNVLEEGSDIYNNHMKRFELPELAFFGLRNKVKPTHTYLTDKRAFWSLFGHLYTYIEYPSFMTDEIKESCLVQDRLAIDLPERNRCISLFNLTSELFSSNVNEYLNNHYLLKNRPALEAVASDMINNRLKVQFEGKTISSRKLCNQVAREISNKSNEKLKSLVNENGQLLVYRGFDIEKSENIRLNRFKVNNPYSHIQATGSGMSYTPIKDGAIVYSLSKFKDTLTLSNKERVFNKSSIKFSLLDVKDESFLDVSSKIPVIGKYQADKKDILFSNVNLYKSDADLHASEITFFPECVSLIDYRILNTSTNVKIFDKVA